VLRSGSDASQAGLDRYLLGQAAALVQEQVLTMLALGGAALAIVLLFYKEFKLLTFDPDFAFSIGFRPHQLNYLLTGLLVVAIVVGLNTVGVVLMSAMLIAPGAAARQWTDRFGVMLVLAAAIGAACGIAGAVLSVLQPRTPTGPVIVLCLAGATVLSLFFGSSRGLVWTRMRRQRALETPR
jgi:manganese/zinc/iron transport system permease protein